MGTELYRMIRDGAAPHWTPAMRLVAMVIADDARDPSQGPPGDGGWPWSVIRVSGYERDGVWHDGITERTGMSRRAISRALTGLARAGYEMREQAGTDREGRPMFAYSGRRALKFRVPPLKPRDGSPSTAPLGPPSTATPRPAKYGDPYAVSRHGSPDMARHGSPDMARHGSPNSATQSPHGLTQGSNPDPHLQAVNSYLEGDRAAAATDDDDFSSSQHADLNGHAEGAWSGQPGDGDYETRPRRSPGLGQCTACGEWFVVGAMGLIHRHTGTRPDGSYGTCPGARQPPARPVRCTGCGRTGLALASLTGLCAACKRDRKEAEAEGRPWP